MGITGFTLSVALFGSVQPHPQVVSPVEVIELAPYGYCVSAVGPVPMDTVLFLRNEEVDIGSGLEARIRGETVYINETGHRDTFSYFSIATAVSPTADIDIQLQFALLDGELFVHWRETYLHRIYRQGLFRVEPQDDWPDRLVPFCEGRGGEEISH